MLREFQLEIARLKAQINEKKDVGVKVKKVRLRKPEISMGQKI